MVHPSPRRRARAAGAGITVVLAVVLVAAPPVATVLIAGEAPYDKVASGFPGLAVALTTSLVHVVAAVSGALTAGALVSVMFLREAAGKGAVHLADSADMRMLRSVSACWALSAAALVVLEALDANGVPFSTLSEPGSLGYLISASWIPKAWALVFVLAGTTFLISFFATRWPTLLIAAWASVTALLAPTAVGQLLVGTDHDIGSDSGYVLTLAETVLVGLIGTVAVVTLRGRLIAPALLRRLFRIVLLAFIVTALAGTAVALFKLSGGGLLDSATGVQVLARAACLAVIGIVLAELARRFRARRLTATSITSLSAVAAVAGAGWIGAGVSMLHIPPPSYFGDTSIAQVYMGFETPLPPSPVTMLTQWRVNVLFLVLSLVAVAVYLIAVRVLRRRGDHWPIGRTLSWVTGWAIIVFVTSSGFGRYSAPDFGVHMIGHMTLNMLAPMFLVLGGVLTLLLRANAPSRTGPAGVHEWITWMLAWRPLRLLFNPVLVFLAYVISYYGLYFSPIFGDYMRYHWAHQLMNLHFLVVGYLFYALVIGVDRPPRPLPHIGKLGFVLAAMPFHAFFGVILMTSDDIVAETFYRYLGMPWADLAASQYVAGGVAWAGGEIPLMVIIVILAVQWSRQDAREAKRTDRRTDRHMDDEFEAYNQMLAQLEEQRGARVPTGGAGPTESERTRS